MRAPTYDKVGIAYMLAGDAPVSNITPSGKKEDGDWVEGLKAHLMILVPDHAMFDGRFAASSHVWPTMTAISVLTTMGCRHPNSRSEAATLSVATCAKRAFP